MRVLPIEENEVNREIMTMLLAGNGPKVDAAANGRGAVDAIASSTPDGYRATERIRAVARQGPRQGAA